MLLRDMLASSTFQRPIYMKIHKQNGSRHSLAAALVILGFGASWNIWKSRPRMKPTLTWSKRNASL